MSIFMAGDCKPVKPRSNALDASETVKIYHPGYSPPKLMLILVAFEALPGRHGVPFSVILDACRILANNREGTVRVRGANVDLIPPDGNVASLLPPGEYTYCVTGGEARYAICASFRAWSPPPVVPSHWNIPAQDGPPPSTASTYSTLVKAADGRCAVTGDVSRLATCHLVPLAEDPWWRLRGMTALTNNPDGINSAPNCLALRADLTHAGMDEGHFVFAPFNGTEAVCVCLSRGMPDFAAEYHLRAIEMPRRIHPMNVYVRFAWGLFRVFEVILRQLERDPEVVTVEEPVFPNVGPRKRKRDDGGGDEEQREGCEGLTDAESYESYDSEPRLDLDIWTEQNINIAEAKDAALDGRPLAPYEEEAGMYRG
ncbi:hypothetical protein B0H12DRAFT_1147224 [Mycena haematopus]|nr:hypothetical protein B0H12DRAFT_1147224 [Mycena haematopus]